MKLMKTTIILCFMISSFTVFAQESEKGMKGQVVGKVIDAASNEAIEFATISIYYAENNELVTGGVTDESGNFAIMIPFGRFTALVESVSYQSGKIEVFSVTKKDKTSSLGVLKLEVDVAILEEVEVTAEKSRVQFALDKKIFNVGKDVAAGAGSVTDVLDNIPSVSVDPQGNVSLRGSQSVKILIDGRPSAMTKAKLLQNIQSNTVDRIELITNPSAKFDAEGLSGIINIVMKKEKRIGVSGSLNSSISYPQDYNLGLNLNRRNKRVNFFTNLGLRYWERPQNKDTESQFILSDSTFYTNINGEQIRRSLSANANVGLDYYINDNNVITTSFLYDIGRQPHEATTFYQDFDENRLLSSNEIRKNDELEVEQSLEYLLSYERSFEKKGKKLEAFVKYIDNTENNDSDISEYLTDQFENPINTNILKQRTIVDESDQNLIFQIDYVQPIDKKGKLEFGAKSTFRNIANNFLVEENGNDGWVTLEGLSNDFSYIENVHAVYASMGNKKEKFSYNFGLRAELTDLKTELKQTGEINDRDPYINLFPSAHLGYEFEDGNSFQVSYSRRIQRPRFRDLNPFFSFSDDRFISTGNPDLNPMYTNSFEIGHIKHWDKTSFGSSLYYRHTNDAIEKIITVNDESGVVFTTPQNLDDRQTGGFEFFVESELKKWLELDASFDLYYAEIDGSSINTEYATDFYAWGSQFGARLRLPKKMLVRLKYFYKGPQSSVQGTLKSNSRFDLSFRKTIMNNNGRLTFSVKDLFNTYRFRFEDITPNVITVGKYRPWRPTYSIRFQYRWR